MANQITLEGLHGGCSACNDANSSPSVVNIINTGSQDSSRRYSRDDHGAFYADSSGEFTMDASGRFVASRNDPAAPGSVMTPPQLDHTAQEQAAQPQRPTYPKAPAVPLKTYAEFY